MTDHLEYNSERNQLVIPEYGRHVQKMVEHCLKEEDKSKRTQMAHAIVEVMANINPNHRDATDFQQKLWDQLFIISDFKLDVDAPYDIPDKEELFKKPEPLPYPQNHPKYRFYGNNISRMINEAIKVEDGKLKEALVYTIANHMKKCFLNWNRDSVKDSVIFKHLEELSDGKLTLKSDDETLSEASDLIKNHVKRKPKKNYKNKGRKRYKK
ncbi:DUF4290 domain-containing protein [Flavobacteriaceae bacterium 14752]|uniref:DUF4290 domain-containing protein n=1 Tax=Mesohalobacter salilacus TaxID=2491711 RepID=UPI000F62F567|nr:DUF4290 domain-containing protein [Flavobacteriaceae bacterium 14752]